MAAIRRSAKTNEERDTVNIAASAVTTATDITESNDVTRATTPATFQASPSNYAAQLTWSHISPLNSTETTPLPANSQPATMTPELDSVVVVEISDGIPVASSIAPPPDVPLLDSRQIPYNPLGFVAELASELTAQCHEEIHPPPVELPSNEIMVDTSEPVVFANAFPLAPVELHSDEVPAGRRAMRNTAEPKTLLSEADMQAKAQQSRAHQAVQELLHRPYRPPRQNSMPQSASSHMQPPSGPTEPAPGKYQPYNPAKHATVVATAMNRYSTPESHYADPASSNKRHSLAGSAPSQLRPSQVPAALQPPQVPPKRPLDSPDFGPQGMIPGSGARHESISGPVFQGTTAGLGHVPSVLQPARGRPIRVQSPPQSQGASPHRGYQAYQPYRDLQRDIEDTVQLLTKTGYGQGGETTPPEASNPGKPQVSRTSTLPANLPSLPYMGVRPHLPHSPVTAPVTSGNLQSRQIHSQDYSGGGASREASTAAPHQYAAPLPPSSADLPQPLNIHRKPPMPAPVNILPTVTASPSPPVTANPDMIPRKATPVLYDTMIVTTPTGTGSGPEANFPSGSSGSGDQAATFYGQAEPLVQPNLPPLSSTPQATPFQMQAPKAADQSASSHGGSQSGGHPPFEQAVSSGFSVVLEPSIPSAPDHTAPGQPSSIKPEAGSQPSSSHTLAAEVNPLPLSLNNATRVLNTFQPPPSSGIVLQDGGQPESSHPSSIVSNVTRVSSAYVISDHQPMAQVHDQTPPEPNVTPPTTQAAQTTPPNVPYASPAVPATARHRSSSSNPSNVLDAQQAVTPPQPSATPRASSILSPSPVSRASSPAVHRESVSQSPVSVQPPAATPSFAQNRAPAGQVSPNQNTVYAPSVGLGASPMAPPPSSHPPPANSSGPGYMIPSGHHPLGSHPVSISQSPTPESPMPIKPDGFHANGPGVDQPPSTYFALNAPGVYAQAPAAPQNYAGDSHLAGTSTQQPPQAIPVPLPSNHSGHNPSQGPPMPVPPPLFAQQQAVRPPTVMTNQGQVGSQQPMPQPLPAAGPTQLTMHSGQSPPMPIAQGRPPMPNVSGQAPPGQAPPDQVPPGQAPPGQAPPGQAPPSQAPPSQAPLGQAPQSIPQRTLSLMSPMQPAAPQSGRPTHPGAPVTAPPQMMFVPPSMPPGNPPQRVQPGMLPQQPYAFHPGMQPQAGMGQHQPIPPHMMQQHHMPGGPHPHPMQAPQKPPSQSSLKEEKGWFGKLWRSDSVKKTPSSGAPGGANKLQKQGGPLPHPSVPQQGFFPQQPPHHNQGQPGFAPGPQPGMPPHMMMMHQQQHQLQQPPPGMQQQQQSAPQPPPQFQQQHQQFQHQQNAPPQSQPRPQPPPQFQQQQQQQQQPQTLAWKNGNGDQIGPVPHPQLQFESGNLNPSQPVMPPPHMRQAIQQQQQQLGGKNGNAGSGGWGGESTSGYDGSGWGDEDYR